MSRYSWQNIGVKLPIGHEGYAPYLPSDIGAAKSEGVSTLSDPPAYIPTVGSGGQGFSTIEGWPPPPVVGDVVLGFEDLGPARVAPTVPTPGEVPCEKATLDDICKILVQNLRHTIWDRARYKRFVQAEWQEPPFQAVEHGNRIDEFNDTPVSDGAGSATTVVSLTLPPHMTGIVTHFGQWANSLAGFNNGTWNILVDGGAVRKFVNFQTQLGTLTEPFRFGSPIFIPRGGTIAVQVTNSVSAQDSYKAVLRGWYQIPQRDQPGPNRMWVDHI